MGDLSWSEVAAMAIKRQARVLEGLVTGMGFIGGGAILKNERSVHGTSTAASLWSTGAIGATTAYGFYPLAVLISLFNLLTFVVLGRLARAVRSQEQQNVILASGQTAAERAP